MEDSPPDFQTDPESFLRLLGEHERWLATYVYSLVAPSHDAEDLLQEVKITLWKQFSRFKTGSNFRAWARTVAFHHILNYRRSVKRHPSSAVDEAFLEAIAAEIDRHSDALERKSDLLRLCLGKLPEAHRKMIHWRYYDECTVEDIASRTQRSVDAVYRLLSRIRAALSDCVQLHSARGGGS